MLGGEPLIDWAVLAPHIEHETREAIVEALHCIGPLSVPDLKAVLGDPEFNLAYVAYHVTTLLRGEVLVEIGQRPTGASTKKFYFLTLPA